MVSGPGVDSQDSFLLGKDSEDRGAVFSTVKAFYVEMEAC